jgi:hypothetical protein
VMTVRIGEPTL